MKHLFKEESFPWNETLFFIFIIFGFLKLINFIQIGSNLFLEFLAILFIISIIGVFRDKYFIEKLSLGIFIFLLLFCFYNFILHRNLTDLSNLIDVNIYFYFFVHIFLSITLAFLMNSKSNYGYMSKSRPLIPLTFFNYLVILFGFIFYIPAIPIFFILINFPPFSFLFLYLLFITIFITSLIGIILSVVISSEDPRVYPFVLFNLIFFLISGFLAGISVIGFGFD